METEENIAKMENEVAELSAATEITEVSASSKQDESIQNAANASIDALYTSRQLLARKRMAFLLGYSGTGYSGMQYNPPPSLTIEGDLFDALIKVGALTESQRDQGPIVSAKFSRAARTDKGVHALGQVVACRILIKRVWSRQDELDLVKKLNEVLVPQIRIFDCIRVTASFDPRRYCDRRRYEYLVPTFVFAPQPEIWATVSKYFDEYLENLREEAGAFDEEDDDSLDVDRDLPELQRPKINQQSWIGKAKSFFERNRSMIHKDNHYPSYQERIAQYPKVEDEVLALFARTLKCYEGTHNFVNFTKDGKADDSTSLRFIHSCETKPPEKVLGMEVIRVVIVGQSFIYNQIRNMIGFAIEIARRNLEPEPILSKALLGNIYYVAPLAPAEGLFLDASFFDNYNERYAQSSEKQGNSSTSSSQKPLNISKNVGEDDLVFDDENNEGENDNQIDDDGGDDEVDYANLLGDDDDRDVRARIDFDLPHIQDQVLKLKHEVVFPAMLGSEAPLKAFEQWIKECDASPFPFHMGYTIRSDKFIKNISAGAKKRRLEIIDGFKDIRSFVTDVKLKRKQDKNSLSASI